MGNREADRAKTGRVVAHFGLRVRIDTGGGEIEWKPPRRESWVVGDYVRFDGDRPKTIEPRRNELVRVGFGGARHTLAANLDRLLVVTSCDLNFKTGLIDRFIVAAGHAGIGAEIALNKIDLPDTEGYIAQIDVYRGLGYEVYPVSAMSGEGVESLAESMKGLTCAMVGHSGVGKTSLLNMLAPGLERGVADVHGKTGRGRHKTTSALLVELPGGGFIIDSPGIRQFTPSGLEPEDVAHHFPGLSKYAGECKFRDCKHLTEPGCAVTAAVETGALDEGLYASYRRLFESVKEHTEPRW